MRLCHQSLREARPAAINFCRSFWRMITQTLQNHSATSLSGSSNSLSATVRCRSSAPHHQMLPNPVCRKAVLCQPFTALHTKHRHKSSLTNSAQLHLESQSSQHGIHSMESCPRLHLNPTSWMPSLLPSLTLHHYWQGLRGNRTPRLLCHSIYRSSSTSNRRNTSSISSNSSRSTTTTTINISSISSSMWQS